MCVQLTKKRKLNSSIFYFIAISLGIISGLSDFQLLQNAGLLI